MIPWYPNYAKKEGLNSASNLHLASLRVWNLDMRRKDRERVVDLFAGCKDVLAEDQALNATRGIPGGQHGLVSYCCR